MTDLNLIGVENIRLLLMVLIPVVIIQLGLQIYAIVHLAKRERVKFDKKWIWALIILLLNILGPIIYFIFSEED
ncbi:phospholipase D-like protein [Natranaerovirga pectinivora]|uniref:Phospholipase D-like protein n=1 Tax=Natranaerovirga pectinivora TaxID=682400 RepID=A0A4R3MP89_9FIRM|nr:PLDc N-terminal domain-containing protein [Natranaerovirga pectinivora]TCT14644.1 phospholipase D-like protein [Natranaerovirga pectinivora]